MSRDPQSGVHVTYSRQYRRCNKADCPTCRDGGGHGPYWYAYWREDGRLRSRYLGRDAPPGAAAGSDVQIATQDRRAEGIAAPERHQHARREPASKPGAHALLASPPLRVRTLGDFSVWAGEERVPAAAWTRRKVAGLFKCLLSAPGQRLARETALELLWPDEDPAASGANLRLTLHRLRRALDGEGHGAGYVRSEGDVLYLTSAGAAAHEWLDTAAFERAAAAALAGSDVSACRAALALYTGDYLPDDSYEEWTITPRETLRRRYLELLLHLAGVHEAAGSLDEAVYCLDAVLSVDPSTSRPRAG